MMRAELQWGVRALLVACVIGAPAAAFGHTYVMTPPPRDIAELNLDARAHKSGPCGGVPRTGKPTQYAIGAAVTVKWQETIDHQGCFQIGFSQANDTGFTVLKQINDPAGSPDDMVYTDTVTLPAGVSCSACTLVVRQLMNNAPCTGDTATPMDPALSAGGTYYSCADICVGDTCVSADGGAASDGGSTGASGGPAGTPPEGGGSASGGAASSGSGSSANPNLRSGAGQDCGLGRTSPPFSRALGGVGLALVAIAAVARRRRKRA